MKVYVGCALTHSPEDFKKSVQKFKAKLKAMDHESLEFIGTLKGTPKDVYLWDIAHCLKKSEAFIAICDYPAIGLGFELGAAQADKKPVLALAHKDSQLTRLVAGLAEVEPNVTLVRYSKLEDDGAKIALDWLENL